MDEDMWDSVTYGGSLSNVTVVPCGTSGNCSVTEDANISLDAEFTMRMIYVAIGCVGMCGNGLVVGVIVSSKRLRKTTTNILIGNQSAIDFSAALFIVLTSLIRNVHVIDGLVAKEIFCRLWMDNFPIWGLFVSSTYNLLSITLERYSAIVHPMRHRQTCSRGKSRMAIVFAWVWGLGYNLAYMVPSSPYKNGECTAYSEWPSPIVQNVVGLLTIVVQYFLPLIIITFAYIRIVAVLMKSFKGTERGRNTTVRPQDAKREKLMMRARKNVVKTLVLVSFSFVLCWSPNQIIYTMYNLGGTINFNGAFYHFTVIAVFLNCCMNPIIYCFQYDQFKDVLFGRCKKEQTAEESFTSDVNSTRESQTYPSNVNGKASVVSSVYVVENPVPAADNEHGMVEMDNIIYDEDA